MGEPTESWLIILLAALVPVSAVITGWFAYRSANQRHEVDSAQMLLAQRTAIEGSWVELVKSLQADLLRLRMDLSDTRLEVNRLQLLLRTNGINYRNAESGKSDKAVAGGEG